MKKIILIILISIFFITNVSADENYEIPIGLLIEPTYSIKLPRTLDISANSTTLSFYVKADIFLDQCLTIDFDENVQIESSNSSMAVSINPNTFSFTAEQLSDTYEKYSLSLTHGDLNSGNYTGTLNFLISLKGENNE